MDKRTIGLPYNTGIRGFFDGIRDRLKEMEKEGRYNAS